MSGMSTATVGNVYASFALVAVYAVAVSDRVSQDQHGVTALQCRLTQSLQSLMSDSHASEPGLYARVLIVISSIRELGTEYRRLFEQLKGNPDYVCEIPSEILEILGLV